MDMTSAEAYVIWFYSEYGRYPDPIVDTDFLAWKAACEWQRQRDADIADYFGDTTVIRDAIIEQWPLPT